MEMLSRDVVQCLQDQVFLEQDLVLFHYAGKLFDERCCNRVFGAKVVDIAYGCGVVSGVVSYCDEVMWIVSAPYVKSMYCCG